MCRCLTSLRCVGFNRKKVPIRGSIAVIDERITETPNKRDKLLLRHMLQIYTTNELQNTLQKQNNNY